MSETSLEERHYQRHRTPAEAQATSLARVGHRYRAACDVRVSDSVGVDEAVWAHWRSEILQVMSWLADESFGDEADAPLLERFLGVDAHVDPQHLDRLREEGYVERVGDRYKLTEAGARTGSLELAASFDDLMKPANRECGPDSGCPNWRNGVRIFE